MARPRKIQTDTEFITENDAEKTEITIENLEEEPITATPEQVPSIKAVEEPKSIPIMKNPYLSEVQKSFLFKYEMDNFIRNIKGSAFAYTLLKPANGNNQEAYLIKARPEIIKDAWKFYKENTDNPSTGAFFQTYVIPYADTIRIDYKLITELVLE